MNIGQLIGVLITAGVAVFATVITQIYTGRRWRTDRQEREWAEALAMARVASDPNESELAKSIASMRLDSLGINREWLEKEKATDPKSLAEQLFSRPANNHDADIEIVERALAITPVLDPDLERLASALTRVDTAFARARADARPEEDTKVRIFLIMIVFTAIFALLAVGAAWQALV